MKKLLHICFWAIIVFCLAGCSKPVPQVPTVSLDKAGKLTCTYVEDFTKDFYSEIDLEGEIGAEIEAEVGNYNQKFGSPHLKLELFQVEEGTAKMQLVFDEAKYYTDYTGLELFTGTVAEAKEAGYGLEGEFLDTEGSLTDLSLFAGAEHAKALILELDEVMQVEIPGKVLCVTPTTNVEIVGKNAVSVKEVQQVCVIYE